jgi:hypothetical protein
MAANTYGIDNVYPRLVIPIGIIALKLTYAIQQYDVNQLSLISITSVHYVITSYCTHKAIGCTINISRMSLREFLYVEEMDYFANIQFLYTI